MSGERRQGDGGGDERPDDDDDVAERMTSLDLDEPKPPNRTPTLDYLQSAVEELYEFNGRLLSERENVPPHDGTTIAEKIGAVTTLFRENEGAAVAENKSQYFYLLGKTWSVVRPVNEECVNVLSKSVKLNPTHLDAWNALGECLVHLRRFSEAKCCFLASLKHGKSKIILRNLSIIMREARLLTSENCMESLEAGVEYAKQAVELDDVDGESWTILGNAYLSLFFKKQEDKLLGQSILSFDKALNDPKAAKNADLHFNRGVALKYAEFYTDALLSFEKSTILDPTWDIAKETLEDLLKYVTSTHTLCQRKGQMKNKRLLQMTETLDSSCLGLYKNKIKTIRGQILLEHVSFSKLKTGLNTGKVVCGRVVCVVYHEEAVPYTFCMVDKELTCIVVSAYNLAQGKGPIIGDSVAIPEPYMSHLDIAYKNQKFQYPSLRVNLPLTMAVNKKCLSADCVSTPQFSSKQF